jgi:hypothetical protein
MKNAVSWLESPCSSETARRFGGTYRLHLQVRSVGQARNQQKQATSRASSAGLLRDLLSDPENGGDVHPKRQALS